jgi:hypothetical protein
MYSTVILAIFAVLILKPPDMRLLFRLFTLPLLLLLLFSCKTDFDVIANYKEITVVYGLLNKQDSVHYLRITKAFLGNGNALVYAQNPDSSQYGTAINVELVDSKSSNVIVFDTVTIHDKDTGVFFSPNQQMYMSTARLDSLSTYTLRISNKQTGHEVSSKTDLIHEFFIQTPKQTAKKIGFPRDIVTQQKLEWRTAANGKRYQPIIRFYYKETSNLTDTITRMVEWVFSSSTSEGITQGEEMWANYMNEDFYRLCEAQIPYTDAEREAAVKVRLPDHFDVIFTIVGIEFSTYLDLNGPTTGLLLEKPVYSNVTNGIGVFSSQYVWKKSYGVNDQTKASLQNTVSLHFFAN